MKRLEAVVCRKTPLMQWLAAQVHSEFSPNAFASWFHDRIAQWAQATNRPGATAHAFRETSLQHARRGEDVNRLVAKDARLSEAVMTGHYTTEEDEELRQASNRTYHRIVLSLSQEVASRYGYRPECKLTDLRNRLSAATAAEDWALVAKLAEELRQKSETANAEKLPSEGADEGGVSENI